MQRKELTLIMLLALLARVVVFVLVASGYVLVGEGDVQADLARNFTQGRGLMLSGSMFHHPDPRRDEQLEFFRRTGGFYGVLIPDQPTSFFVPGYVFFEAFIFLLTSGGNLTAVVAAQLLLGLLTVYLGIRIALRFLPGRWCVAAGVFMALDPFELYYEAIPVTQALFSLLFVAGLLLSIRFLEKPVLLRGFVTAVVWGVTFLVRPVALPLIAWLVLVALIASSFSRRIIPVLLLSLSVFAAVLLPWVLRNKSTTDRYLLLPLQGGVQMWEFNGRIFTDEFIGEQKGARLLYGPVRARWLSRLNRAELADFPDFTTESEFERDSVLYHRQIEFIKANPVLFLDLAACRFVEFFKPFPLNRFSMIHSLSGFVSFFWVGLFFAAGTVLLLRMGWPGVFLAGVIAGYTLMHLLTAAGTPHRVALDVPLFIASLVALRYVVQRFKRGKELS